ncbi:hypothetical protein BST26_14350 [Mycolicibacterium insubricum]|uniref:Uncharacterized protein n=2 Tax=Mycolicibacterium insubricum TaxID=444597 RepID=A0A1X0D8K6_9MYCO|nr:hypothetical protein [Mycolicibacterium insubricum]ORA68549.1 hypothetical protein BST26_14350 [Mycolicibacterium insubricum]
MDTVTLRFAADANSDLHELRATDVAQVLQGLAGIVGDFDKAHVFHDEGPANSVVFVRPPQEGSFIIEAVRVASEHWETVKTVGKYAGPPTIAQAIWWSTKSMRADVKSFQHLENGNVKVDWQDNTSEEIPAAAWEELNKRKRRRKKQLREIMAPLGDARVTELDVSSPPPRRDALPSVAPTQVVLTREDYDSVAPTDDIAERAETFEVLARMQTIDFADSTKWRVKPSGGHARKAVVADAEFLKKVAKGLAISNTDVFRLQIREDTIVKNGRTRSSWTVLKVESHRRTAGDDDV